MLSVGFVPSDWLRAIIIPVFKKSSAAIATNYRPISLTCVASKVMERIIAKALLEHLVENDLLSSAQHGFLKGKSTCTNLLESYNDWTLCLQNKHGVTVAYIDCSKAFDSVSHKKLFVRLAQYGICGNLHIWLENFFTERSHQTRVNASLSDASALYSGVVQGSGIGPVAFLIYVDNLAEVLLQYGVRVKIFADDVKAYVEISHDSTVNELQTVLDVIYAWATEWQLQVSVE